MNTIEEKLHYLRLYFSEGLGTRLRGGWDRTGQVNTCTPGAMSGQETFCRCSVHWSLPSVVPSYWHKHTLQVDMQSAGSVLVFWWCRLNSTHSQVEVCTVWKKLHFCGHRKLEVAVVFFPFLGSLQHCTPVAANFLQPIYASLVQQYPKCITIQLCVCVYYTTWFQYRSPHCSELPLAIPLQ